MTRSGRMSLESVRHDLCIIKVKHRCRTNSRHLLKWLLILRQKGWVMGIQDKKVWSGDLAATDSNYAWRFPVKHEMDGLLKELAAFNEGIIELEKAGHTGHAMDVLKANALRLAGHIDELRSFLVVRKH